MHLTDDGLCGVVSAEPNTWTTNYLGQWSTAHIDNQYIDRTVQMMMMMLSPDRISCATYQSAMEMDRRRRANARTQTRTRRDEILFDSVVRCTTIADGRGVRSIEKERRISSASVSSLHANGHRAHFHPLLSAERMRRLHGIFTQMINVL